MINLVEEKYKKYREQLQKVQIKEGLKIAMEISSIGNKYLQDNKYWEAENKASGRYVSVLFRSTIVCGVICNFIRLVSFLIEPYLPSTSAKINFILQCPRTERCNILGKWLNEGDFLEKFCLLTEKSTGLNQPVTLFKLIAAEKIKEWR